MPPENTQKPQPLPAIPDAPATTATARDPQLPETAEDEEITFLDMVKHLFTEYVSRPSVQTEVFRPLLKWFLWNLMPYVLLFIGLNFFTTLAAVAFVFYSVNKTKKI